ncbi:hypothetical protein [Candidatus Viadribacter manganicus]|uniref:Uncharacterized protein n=1 Tax=Candidatus Viadribacter manganicus TaxID=1759059 RepID=A0A1B1AGN4_9PROT|nr:hypothetical protein [Candidatus Viadribacter manganicus]ANP45723.1 hypothetical protein ATE48_07225 [Candidatus Viadribacter manganicus]
MHNIAKQRASRSAFIVVSNPSGAGARAKANPKFTGLFLLGAVLASLTLWAMLFALGFALFSH